MLFRSLEDQRVAMQWIQNNIEKVMLNAPDNAVIRLTSNSLVVIQPKSRSWESLPELGLCQLIWLPMAVTMTGCSELPVSFVRLKIAYCMNVDICPVGFSGGPVKVDKVSRSQHVFDSLVGRDSSTSCTSTPDIRAQTDLAGCSGNTNKIQCLRDQSPDVMTNFMNKNRE